MTFPGELCSWCSEGHTPGHESGWLPPLQPGAGRDTWFAYRSMTTPGRIEPDGSVTLHGPPVPRLFLSGACVVLGLALALWIASSWGQPVVDVLLLFVCMAYVVAGVRVWRARIRIRPDRLEIRGVLRSRVVPRSDVQRVGIGEWGYDPRARASKRVALQLHDGATVYTPVTVQGTERSVRALFDLLTAWVADAER